MVSLANTFVGFIENNSKLFNEEIEKLFVPQGGFPLINKQNKWTLAKNLKGFFEDKQDYFKFLASKIIEEGQQICQLSCAENLIKTVNKAAAEINLKDRIDDFNKKGLINNQEILFNSKIKKYEWLSNFFPTLILVKEPMPAIFYSAEVAYKATKYYWSHQNKDAFLNQAKITDSLQAKKIEATIDEETMIKVMKDVIDRKFDQNSVLKGLLKNTTGGLVEHTENNFWGDGSTSSVKGSGRNELGQILIDKRKSLS